MPAPSSAGRGATTWTVAASIGADVPFCLVGGRARVEGIGERVTPLEYVERYYLLLLPPFGVDTASVFRAWDAGHREEGANALTAAALATEPRLAAWRDALGELSGQAPTLAGQRFDVVRRGWSPRRGHAGSAAARGGGDDGPTGADPDGARGVARRVKRKC